MMAVASGGSLIRLRTAALLRLREARACLDDARGPVDGRRNLLIYGQGRVGTTLLETLLVSTGHFTGHHEALNTVTRDVWRPGAFVRGLGRRRTGGHVVVHVKPEHLGRARQSPVDPALFLDMLLADGWTILHVMRRDTLRQVLSKEIAKARGGFHKRSSGAEPLAPITLPVDAFLARCDRVRQSLAAEHALLAPRPHLRLIYEDDLEQAAAQQPAVDRILDHLALPRRVAVTTLQKINTHDPAALIANLDDLRRAVLDHGQEWTL